MLFLVESGFETTDAGVIDLARAKADEISELFSAAVRRGEISMSDLFDEAYRDVPGTDPQQVVTRFTGFADRVLPDVQEPVLGFDKRIAFCAAVDRNGYLPTHNAIYSQPQWRPLTVIGAEQSFISANCPPPMSRR